MEEGELLTQAITPHTEYTVFICFFRTSKSAGLPPWSSDCRLTEISCRHPESHEIFSEYVQHKDWSALSGLDHGVPINHVANAGIEAPKAWEMFTSWTKALQKGKMARQHVWDVGLTKEFHG